MTRIICLIFGLLGTTLVPAVASAGTESGLYLGAGVGRAGIGDIDASEAGTASDINFDASDTGWKVFAGYNFGWIPLVDLAIEGGYVDFGQPDDNGVQVDLDGYDLFALVGFNLGPVGLFGKVGGFHWDGRASGNGNSASDDGTDPAYGLGARLKFGSVEVRAEYEYFDISAANDVSLISASAAWTF